MAFTLISLITLASTALAAPVPNCAQNIVSVADDTCDSLGTKYGVTSAEILAANSFLDCTNIWTGTPICVPASSDTPVNPGTETPSCSSTYVVPATGETCQSIGTKFGVTAAQIKSSNDFLNCDDIWQWTSVCIPSGGSTTPTNPTCSSTYVAVSGETCDTIASKFGVTSAQVKSSNDFVNCDDIWQGTNICVPPGGSTTPTTPTTPSCSSTYVVAGSGETCDTIATKYGVTSAQIKSNNDFVNCQDIWQGTNICIPQGATTPAPTCYSTYTATGGQTCDAIGAIYGISGTEVHNANSFLDCNNIWAGTPICITTQNSPSGGNNGGNNSGNSGGNEVNYGGFATWFYQNGNAGACGQWHGDYDLIVAIDQERYGYDFSQPSYLCGKYVTIKNPANGNTVTAQIADVCPTCDNGNSIDLSLGVFQALADLGVGHMPIEWSFV